MTSTTRSTWSAPVRYAEVDGQGVVFNAHYLLYCDEAMAKFCRDRELPAVVVENSRVVSCALQWTASLTRGDTAEVAVSCMRVGRTSFTLSFDIASGARKCCQVETTYVFTDADAVPTPLPDELRARLS